MAWGAVVGIPTALIGIAVTYYLERYVREAFIKKKKLWKIP